MTPAGRQLQLDCQRGVFGGFHKLCKSLLISGWLPDAPVTYNLFKCNNNTPTYVCKTPYRVLNAPELADDFYLNLVNWSNMNVLGVGLGSCVYLWTAHNSPVSNDTVGSVSWVQKCSRQDRKTVWCTIEMSEKPLTIRSSVTLLLLIWYSTCSPCKREFNCKIVFPA
ncbi:uncharacterized protein F5891DRAFT_986294 [Suillus fuscotomentosus]|uniref:Uncharacterized protein n=1 Tax=Suillus fuscotomentosus TaxID=1912939 RepID=A0AAD4DS75_9AGAM|nr:uncharacterized protein F5891DRAFT_986294 [Suillus fuscotomentosus]KAG1892970.1 hypothetical protein F5891DRAFT_986294 [Suillus fuscotomentosus]